MANADLPSNQGLRNWALKKLTSRAAQRIEIMSDYKSERRTGGRGEKRAGAFSILLVEKLWVIASDWRIISVGRMAFPPFFGTRKKKGKTSTAVPEVWTKGRVPGAWVRCPGLLRCDVRGAGTRRYNGMEGWPDPRWEIPDGVPCEGWEALEAVEGLLPNTTSSNRRRDLPDSDRGDICSTGDCQWPKTVEQGCPLQPTQPTGLRATLDTVLRSTYDARPPSPAE